MKPYRVKGLEPEGPLRPNAARIVQTRLDELRSLVQPALDSSSATAQHDLRIAAKRLRYVLEIVEGCFSEEAKAVHEAAKELQRLLGEIHDCDVMLPRIEGIESLEERLRTRREEVFRCFHGVCQVEASRGTWAALESAL